MTSNGWNGITVCVLFVVGLAVVESAFPRLVNSGSTYFSEYENFTVGDVLKMFRVTDADAGDNITVTIETPATRRLVNIIQHGVGNDVTVDIILLTELDRDEPGSSSRRLQFLAMDTGGNVQHIVFTMYILDVNDNAPVFQNEPYTIEIKEDAAWPSIVPNIRVTATDPDNSFAGHVTYNMQAHSQSPSTRADYMATFEINTNNGSITLKKELDYETNTYYQFHIYAQDHGTPAHTTTTNLIIRILDVQDTPPFFTRIPYRTEIDENTPVGDPVIKIDARDGDSGVSNPLQYSIEPGDCSDFFNISQDDGQIYVAKAIDRDAGVIKYKGGECSFPVMVSEINGTQPQFGKTTTTTDVTVTIRDLNDNSPEFTQATYHATVQENTQSGVPITLDTPLAVHDKGEGNNAKMTITLMYPDNTNCSDFQPNPAVVTSTGSIMIMVKNKTILDYEARRIITFMVVATEAADPSHVATATVVLNLIDMNDNSPDFGQNTYEIYIPENTPSGTTIGTITANDKDSGINGNVSYTIFGGQDRFLVDTHSGTITTNCASCNAELDREKKSIYYMTYTATDGNGRSNAASLVVNLDDVNDNAPKFRSDTYNANIAENDDKYGTEPVVTVEALDADKEHTNNSKIRYSILSCSDHEMENNITINPHTGEIFLSSPIDYEQLNESDIRLIVGATDLGTHPLSSNVTVTITVEDKNDNFPNFTNSTFEASVDENVISTINKYYHFGNVKAVDKDGTARNNKFNYFITEGGYEKFKINSTSGEVSVQANAKLDREMVAMYNITINTIDQGSPPLTSTATLYVTINDVNDEDPEFNQTEYHCSVLENITKVGTNIITAYATDVDSTSDLRYTIIDVAATDETGHTVNSSLVEHYFDIHPDNGTVYIASITDRETADSIILTVQVEDLKAARRTAPQTATASVIIRLLDINDNRPAFTESTYDVNVSENAINGVVLRTIEATDRDVNRTITYTLQHGPSPIDSFSIDTHKGILKKIGNIDREENNTIKLTIVTTDNGVPALSSAIDVTVNVLDYNDNAPDIDHHNDTYYVAENAGLGTEVATITAKDKDINENANIKFEIRSGGLGDFAINETTGEISVSGQLDRETTAKYTLIVVAKDNPKRPPEQRSSQTTVIVEITDTNDNPPVFTPTEYYASIQENYQGTSIAQVTATDEDKKDSNNAKILYSIVNATYDTLLFSINGGSGVVSVNNSLEGHVGTYMLRITAQDHGVPPKDAMATMNITVMDVNLNKPVLGNIPPNSTIRVYECARLYTQLWHFNATDADHGQNAAIEFSITGLDGDITDFRIDKVNGSLYTAHKLSVSRKEKYMFQVHVQDKGVPPRRSELTPTVTLEVIDVNDHTPSFPDGDYHFAVDENAIGAHVGTVVAIDEDINSRSCYKIEDGAWTNHFSISQSKGIILTSMALNRENISQIVLNVTVRDCSAAKSTGDVCDNTTTTPDNAKTSTNVKVTVRDVDDNPPRFVIRQITTGMSMNTEPGTPLELQLKDTAYVTDKDTPANGYNKWRFGMNGDVTVSDGLIGVVGPLGGILPCEDGKTHVFCVTGNGSVIINRWFSGDSGYFLLPVVVRDGAGNDTAVVKIFLIGYSQVLIMTLFGPKSNTAPKKEHILQAFSDVTGYTFVYDSIHAHKTFDGVVDTQRTDLHFHVVDPKTQRVLDAEEVKRLVDRNVGALANVRLEYQIGDIAGGNWLEDLPYPDHGTPALTTTTDLITRILDVSETPTPFTRKADGNYANTTTTIAPPHVRSDIRCEADAIAIFLPGSVFPAGHNITWREERCTVTYNGSHYVDTVRLNDCGTTVHIDTDTVTFYNELTVHRGTHGRSPGNNDITYGDDHETVIPVKCIYPRQSNVSTSYEPVKQHAHFIEKRYGDLDIAMLQYETEQFRTPVPTTSYPRSVPLNDDIFIRIGLNFDTSDIGVKVDHCIATSTPSPADIQWHSIIQSGCPSSHTRLLSASGHPDVRFAFKAFDFSHKTTSYIYVHCEVSVCDHANCTMGCPPRVRRAAADDTYGGARLVTAGPLFVEKRNAKENAGSAVSMTTVFAGLCLCVAMVAVVVAVIGWRRQSRK